MYIVKSVIFVLFPLCFQEFSKCGILLAKLEYTCSSLGEEVSAYSHAQSDDCSVEARPLGKDWGKWGKTDQVVFHMVKLEV